VGGGPEGRRCWRRLGGRAQPPPPSVPLGQSLNRDGIPWFGQSGGIEGVILRSLPVPRLPTYDSIARGLSISSTPHLRTACPLRTAPNALGVHVGGGHAAPTGSAGGVRGGILDIERERRLS
jgi:hypothetical protein